ncbi:MAG: Stp1/IreP family PP2C-type Ser/Thr phosphatase [Lachnospiraceae bacterium]|nr:Stp1/IreP family PP2C-type Ser/Thr phosphatase [Lachnospiraceae bacterium]
MHSAAITNIGQKRRVNQDSYLVQENPVGNLPDLFVVADGMGGHRAGDYASRFTVERLRTKIESAPETDMRSMVTRVLHEINTELRTIAASDEAYYGMGTTCVLCTIDGSRLQVANIGDSRLYIAGKDGMRQVTVDHSLVEEMVLAGGISEASARIHPDKNIITRAIGAENGLNIDFFAAQLSEGELVLMCTDGLTNMVEDRRISAVLKEEATLEEKVRKLVSEANRNGGRDNITALLVDPFA